ncbi:MAG: PEP-CTERM sorting domain-containing protein [bacterium]|nr:PEP-CTERM sorting domain-containing protein [bacterium]
MKKQCSFFGAALVVMCVPGLAMVPAAQAVVFFADDFNVDPTANWTVNDPGLTDILADFHYDYSLIGVPSAPNGTGTRGLKMTANNSGGVFGGFSVSPTGQSFAGNYTVTFDMWQNYAGPVGPGGSGTTQLSMAGIGTAGNVAVWPGSTPKESVMFGVTLDGGSSKDFRVYDSAFPFSRGLGDPVYVGPGGPVNGNDPYYSVFGGAAAPAAQVALYPGQTGVTDGGEPAFTWAQVVIHVFQGHADWSINGLPIASDPLSGLTLGGGNILFGHSDTNGGSSSDPNDSDLNVTLIDNVVVTPEPATLSLLALGGLALLRRRR